MTRALAKAIKNKVNLLLSEIPLPTLETWLLPQAKMLCVIRYQGTNQEEATVQDGRREQAEKFPSLERAVLPPTPSGTAAEPSQAALPLYIRPPSAEPDKLM